MKKGFILFFFIFIFCSLYTDIYAQSKIEPSKLEAKKWFKQRAWLSGLELKPHKTINVREFAKQYSINKIYWDKAFAFLKDHDLVKLAKGKYPIDGDNVFASVTEDSTKNLEKTNWESHRKYIDIQYVINGEELIGVYPVAKASITNFILYSLPR